MYVYILNHNMSGLKDQALAIVMENLKLRWARPKKNRLARGRRVRA